MKAILPTFIVLVGCASRPMEHSTTYIIRSASQSVAVRLPARWQPIWPEAQGPQAYFHLATESSPAITIRLDPARAVDRDGQRAIHEQELADLRETFVAPAARTIAAVPVRGESVLIQLYTGVDTHQYSAVVPLGRETVSFWLSDSHGESIEPYKNDFIEAVRSITWQ